MAWALVVAAAWTLRSRAYAIFRGVQLGLHVLISAALAERFAWAWPVFVALHGIVFVSALFLIWPRLRPLPYRILISIPGAFFGAGMLLAWPWAIAAAFGFHAPFVELPFVLAAIGVIQSLTSREELTDLVVADGQVVEGLRRHKAGELRVERPLRIVQITDPHLGPFMSVARLRRICERAVRRQPDLILLTGDFLTMESQANPELLADALEPLAALPGRVFACFGNHDHEAPAIVRNALGRAGAKLLIDDSTELQTPAGRVQIVGFDFVWRKRAEHLARVTAEHPRVPGALRLLLLHDPGAFRHLPPGEGDLVLSGHTHGGQVGLVSLGLPWTMMRAFVKAPDHGLWARGADRLYVHRGTGHYGFPLRLGVPAEESLLQVHVPERAAG
jgi:predicted MPP superfamily phosphohydrolase